MAWDSGGTDPYASAPVAGAHKRSHNRQWLWALCVVEVLAVGASTTYLLTEHRSRQTSEVVSAATTRLTTRSTTTSGWSTTTTEGARTPPAGPARTADTAEPTTPPTDSSASIYLSPTLLPTTTEAPNPCGTFRIGLSARIEAARRPYLLGGPWDVTADVTASNPSRFTVWSVQAWVTLNGDNQRVDFVSILPGFTSSTRVDFSQVEGGLGVDRSAPPQFTFSGSIQSFEIEVPGRSSLYYCGSPGL